jgi:hypothetical protein
LADVQAGRALFTLQAHRQRGITCWPRLLRAQ